MKQVLANLYSTYGRYIDANRAIPSENDCLKPVERRILISVNDIASSKLQKSAKVVGHTIGNYHPHGDCLHGSTKIFTPRGIYNTIEELFFSKTKKIKILCLDNNNNVIVAEAHSFRIGQYSNTLYEINFKSGGEIITTSNHLINTNKGWISAEKLNIGDRVVSINSLDIIPIKYDMISDIKIVKLDYKIQMYDFTVDEYHNMFIMANRLKNNTTTLVNVHNSSVYESLVGLVNRGFVEGQGNWGAFGYPENSSAAAMRYTECKSNKNINDILKDLIDYVPHEKIELESEPLYLPSPIPLGLIGEGIISGIGFNITKIPRYNYVDLLRRSYSILNNDTELVSIQPKLKNCIIKSNDFDKILLSGEGVLEIIPEMKSLNKKTIRILGRNPLIGFTKLKSFNIKYEETNGYPYFEAIDMTDLNTKSLVDIHVTSYKKSVDKEFLQKILSLISSKVNIKVNIVSDELVKLVGIDYLILKSYDNWKLANLNKFKDELFKLKKELFDLNIIELIREVLKTEHTTDTSVIIKEVMLLNSSLTEQEIELVINKYRIKKIIESSLDKSKVTSDIALYINKINNIDVEVFNLFKSNFLKI